MSTGRRTTPHSPPRWLRATWAVVLAALTAAVAAKAADAAWYRHWRAVLTARGELPSIASARATAALSTLWGHGRGEVLSTLNLTPTRTAASPTPGTVEVTCGDHARNGWDVTLNFNAADRLTGSGVSYNDHQRIGTPAHVAAWLADAAPPAAAVAAIVAIVAGVATVGVWPWRRSVGGSALAAAIVAAVLVHLSGFADRTFVDPKREPIHWVPLGLVVATATVTFWPARGRRVDPGLCPACGYDLTGNVSGVCPECGTAASNKAADAIGGGPTVTPDRR